MNTRYHVYGLGNALVDLDFTVPHTLLQDLKMEQGTMTLIDAQRRYELLSLLRNQQPTKACGGSAGNTLMTVVQLGGQGFYSCKVASDELGDFYYHDMRRAGLDTNLDNERDAGDTGTCIVLVTPDAQRTMNTHLGITETISERELNPTALAQSQYLYIEGYQAAQTSGLAAALTAKKIAQSQGVATSLTLSDINMVRYCRDGLAAIIGDGLDLLFCNELEALAYCETQDLEQACEKLKSLAKSFVITRSEKGSLLFDGADYIHVKAHPVTVKDTLGAGDVYAGAFLYALTQGQEFTACGELASRAAGEVITIHEPRLNAQQIAAIME